MSTVIEEVEEKFPVQHPRLESLTESVNVCAGFGEECGDEIPANLDLCPTHQRAEDRHYTQLAQEQDRREAIDANSQYRHLRDTPRVKYVNPELAAALYTPKGHCFMCSASESPKGCYCRYCNQCDRWWITKERGVEQEEDCAACKVEGTRAA